MVNGLSFIQHFSTLPEHSKCLIHSVKPICTFSYRSVFYLTHIQNLMDISERNLWLVYALGYLACTLGQGSDLVISGWPALLAELQLHNKI